MQKTPAPIFNHRKRQRQAVISEPQGMGFIDAPQQSDLMPITGFGDGGSSRKFKQSKSQTAGSGSYPQSTYNTQQPMGQYNQSQRQDTGQKPMGQYNQHSRGAGQQPMGQYNQPQRRDTGQQPMRQYNQPQRRDTGQQPMGQYNQPQMQGAGQQPLRHYNQQSRGNSQYQQPKNAGQANTMKSNANFVAQQNKQTGQNNKYFPQNQSSYNSNMVGPSGDCTQQTYNRNVCRSNVPAGISTQNQTRGGPPNQNNQQKFKVECYGNSRPKDTFTKENNNVRLGKQDAMPREDKSLRFISTTVEGVKHWSKYRENIAMIFEVYGILDSALLKLPVVAGKTFKLRDDKDVMQCEFFEIDRELPRLIRGHWHRCVGTYDVKTEKFKCVSVRPATLEEKKKSSLNINASEATLVNLSRKMPEP